jgi:hypothetical protein
LTPSTLTASIVGKEFLRKTKLVGAHLVAGHQQPTGKGERQLDGIGYTAPWAICGAL